MQNRKFPAFKNFTNKSNKKPQKKVEVIKQSLIIVDVQNDFVNPSGALYVNGSESVIPAIIDYVEKNKDKINQIIFTRDWHTKKDESFEKNGGEWPVHCVQNTEGAEIDKTLYLELLKTRIPLFVVNKGTVADHEEYGAFEHCGTFHHLHPNIDPVITNCYFSNCESSSGTRILNNDIVICGVAGDYCVKETINNLMKHWKKFNISVLMNGVASIDDGTILNEFIEEHNLKTI